MTSYKTETEKGELVARPVRHAPVPPPPPRPCLHCRLCGCCCCSLNCCYHKIDGTADGEVNYLRMRLRTECGCEASSPAVDLNSTLMTWLRASSWLSGFHSLCDLYLHRLSPAVLLVA